MDETKGPKDGANFSKIDNSKVEIRPGRPKGYPKTGGRVKGTPNKSSSKWSEILEGESFSIPEQAIKMFNDPSTPPNIKFQILQFLASYTTASIKPKDSDENDPEIDQTETTDILSLVSK